MKNKSVKVKVFVAMSGGVDSSVAAALLKKRNFDVVGVHIKGYNVDGCGEREAEGARHAAETLGIPFYVWDFEKEYKDKVVDYMVEGYRKGITPNPDVMCNKEIKFGLFLKKALARGADYVATGHYVRLAVSGQRLGYRGKIKTLNAKRYTLYAARDAQKDQSYFLWTLTQEQLKHCLFPIGDYTKPQVRKLAKKFGLPNAEKKDSQGICFLGQISLKDFLKNYLPEKRGIVLDTSGRIVGEHNGAHFYTIGQRHIGFKHQASSVRHDSGPVYVAEKDAESNAILVAEEGDPALYKKEVRLRNVNLINPKLEIACPPKPWRRRGNCLPMGDVPKGQKLEIPIYVRVRYRQPLVRATLIFVDQDADLRGKNQRESAFKSASIRVLFEKPQKAVAPGQSAVFYSQKGEMLGGGVIA